MFLTQTSIQINRITEGIRMCFILCLFDPLFNQFYGLEMSDAQTISKPIIESL